MLYRSEKISASRYPSQVLHLENRSYWKTGNLSEQQTTEMLPDEFMHYYNPNDFNRVIYHQRNANSKSRFAVLLDDIDKLIQICHSGYDDITEYGVFNRCISEQAIIENNKHRLLTKEDSPKVLHCPAGCRPKSCTYMKLSGQCSISFYKE